MYADTLFDLERGHLLRLGIWACCSIVVGMFILAIMAWRKGNAPFLRHFAVQTLAWGAIDLALVLFGWKGLAFRDYASSVQLNEFLWLNVGLDAGYIGVGVTLALTGWLIGKRLGALGAGVGVAVQGFALFVLDLRLLTVIGSARLAVIPNHLVSWLLG